MTAPPPLAEHHLNQLRASGISDGIIYARGYQSVSRPTPGDSRPRELLAACRIPGWARKDDARYPGLLIPLYRATGEHISWRYRPDSAPTVQGKVRKYAAPGGQASVIDVHPANRNRIVDPSVPLFITEGVKKADSLTSAGLCAVALDGVFNWRSRLGSNGGWEDIPIKGRAVWVVFDSDAAVNPNVARAMERLGAWLRSKGCASVSYVVTPTVVGTGPSAVDIGSAFGGKVGVDDYLGKGGTVAGLAAAATTRAPSPVTVEDKFTDARIAEIIADELLGESHMWVRGLGWLAWNGRVWRSCSDEAVMEKVRAYVLSAFSSLLSDSHSGRPVRQSDLEGWFGMLTAARIRNVSAMARGICEVPADALDADPDVLNTPSGIVDLSTGATSPHDPLRYMTKMTRGSYRPGFAHADWDTALEALPLAERQWLQVRLGQAATGHTTPDGIMPILKGSGENGKSVLLGTVIRALGDYASAASSKLFMSTRGSEHSTEMADLRGRRLVVAEEIAEGKSIDVTALKRIQDVETIRARYIRQDNIEFTTSHSLFATTNYQPVINEVDHGTWRRLALLEFPYTFRKPGEPLELETDRPGDVDLKDRLRASEEAHDAVVTWIVNGAVLASVAPSQMRPTPAITAATKAWRTDADRIMGFWDECLIAERGWYVLTSDLLDAFNAWLARNGHGGWAKETFSSRFGAHQETVRRRVEYRVIKTQRIGSDLVRSVYEPDPASVWEPSRKRPTPVMGRVWFGVRFRLDADDENGLNGYGQNE